MIKKGLFSLMFFVCCTIAMAQSSVETVYLQILKESKNTNKDVILKLGDLNYLKPNYKEAEKYYSRYFALTKTQDAQTCFRYAQSLRENKKMAKSKEIMKRFYAATARAAKTVKRDYFKEMQVNSGRYNIEDVPYNTEYSEYFPFPYEDRMFFISSRKEAKQKTNIEDKDKEYVASVFVTDKNNNAKPRLVASMKGIHEFAIDKDGETIYYARTVKLIDNDPNQPIYNIFRGTIDRGREKITNETILDFNKEGFSMAHPRLNKEGNKLYFVANLEDSLGDTDLYYVDIINGVYSQPKNLGASINTKNKETYPFISDDNFLYFSSKGYPGYGELDIYVAAIYPDGTYGTVYNVGAPLNTPSDDFSFCIDPAQVGYISSNRDGGVGYDDIYKFKETRKLNYNFLLTQMIVNRKDGKPLRDVRVALYDMNSKLVKELRSDKNGKYRVSLPSNKNYRIHFDFKGFYQDEFVINTVKGVQYAPILPLSPIEQKIKKGDDLAKILNIEKLYFSSGKSIVEPTAAFELSKVVALMKQNPKMRIEFRAHTDSRGSSMANLKLSQDRGASVAKWLVQNGVEAKRITYKGFGEFKLLNKCKDGVPCTEAEHAINRRAEFIITSI